MKICSRCGNNGPFYRNRSAKDGLSRYCIDCMKKADRISYWKHRDSVLERKRLEMKKPERRATINATKRRWNARNRDRLRALDARPWRRAQKRAAAKRSYASNPALYLEKNKRWQRNNPEAARLSDRAKRSKRRATRGFATPAQIAARIKLFDGMCAYCGNKPYAHVDHVIPLHCGGTAWPTNLRPACAACNLKKGTQTWCLPTFDRTSNTRLFDYKRREIEYCDSAELMNNRDRSVEIVMKLSDAVTPQDWIDYSRHVIRIFCEERGWPCE